MENLMGRYRNVSILVAAIFIQVVGLAVQVKRHAENQSTRLIRVWTVSAVTPLEKTAVRVQSGATEIWHNYFYLRGVRQQNRELQQQIQQLRLDQVRLQQDAEQARRLQALLGFKEQFIDKTTAAQVIGSSGSDQSRMVYLDKGSSDGIGQDMAVISAEGVVGKVIQVFRHTSQVLLINDQTSGVGTILEKSRLQGVLKGKPSGELTLDHVMAEEDVKAGERVLTSGGDQIFPKGLPVGTVANVSRGAEFLQVAVHPAAALTHLEEVLVITKKAEREPPVATANSVRAADILAQRLPSVPDNPTPATTGTAASATGSNSSPVNPKPGVTAPAVPPTHPTNSPTAVPFESKIPNPATGQAKPPASGTISGPNGTAQPKPVKPAVPPASKPVTKPVPTPASETPGDTPQ